MEFIYTLLLFSMLLACVCVWVGGREGDRLRDRYGVMLYNTIFTLHFEMMYTAENK